LSNTLAEICEVSGANWTDIVSALKLDKRIGANRYLRPGLGISGGNIERDLNTISEIAHSNGLKPEIIQSIINSNSHYKSWVTRKLKQLGVLSKENMSIGIWGLSYKENTNSIKNSPSLEIINQLPSSFYVYAHDPVVQNLSSKNKWLEIVKNPEIILEKTDLLLVLTPWIDYMKYAKSDELRKFSGKVIIDPFKVLDK
jgi:UDPglucose 6-dehydrogenase